MNRRKQFRAVATRFDKLAVRYQATVVEPSVDGVVVTAPVAASMRPMVLVPGALTSPG